MVPHYVKSVSFKKKGGHTEVARGLSFYGWDSHPLIKQKLTLSTGKANVSVGTLFSAR